MSFFCVVPTLAKRQLQIFFFFLASGDDVWRQRTRGIFFLLVFFFFIFFVYEPVTVQVTCHFLQFLMSTAI